MSRARAGLVIGLVAALAACSSSSTNEAGGGGGSAGVAGSGSGGASSGGASSGGAGGISDRCDGACNIAVAAGCANGLTKASCLLSCKALTSAPKCDPTGTAYFDCIDGKTATCNGAGDPEVAGCGIAYLNAVNCAVGENPNPDVVDPCVTYCDGIAAKGCANSAPKADCNTNCLWAGAKGIGCDDEWTTFLACANSHALTCVAGYAVSLACGAEFKVFTKCVNAAGAG
ncbi:MAG: hypothetical protein AMXMBFR56_67310 [Polyangiaceae bacterium]